MIAASHFLYIQSVISCKYKLFLVDNMGVLVAVHFSYKFHLYLPAARFFIMVIYYAILVDET